MSKTEDNFLQDSTDVKKQQILENNGLQLERSMNSQDESFISTNMQSLNIAQGHTNFHSANGSKRKLVSALDQIKSKSVFDDTTNDHYGTLLVLDTKNLQKLKGDIGHTPKILDTLNISHDPHMYHDKNIEEGLQAILDDDTTDSELDQREQRDQRRKSQKFASSKSHAPGWVEFLFLISIFVIAFMAQNQVRANQQIEQMMTIMSDQSEQMKVQKKHIYKIMKNAGMEIKLENDIQAQNAKNIEELKSTEREAKEEVAVLRKDNDEVKEQLKEVENLKQVLSSALKRLDESEQQLTQAIARLDKTEEQEKVLKGGLQTLSKSLDSNVEETNLNKEHISEINDSLEKQEQQLKKENDQLKKLLKDTNALKEETQDSENALSKIQKKEKSIEKKIDNSIETITKKNADNIKTLQGNIDKHTSDLDSVQKENTRLLNVIKTAQANIKGIKSSNLKTNAEIVKLNEFMAQMNKLISDQEKAMGS